MKRLFLLLIPLTFLLFSCSANLNNKSQTESVNGKVRYVSGYIKDTQSNIITLTNGLIFKADRIVTAISMQPVYIVLDEFRPWGHMYLKGEKIQGALMKNALTGVRKQYVQLAQTEDLIIYNTGKIMYIKNVFPNKETIELKDGSTWKINDVEDLGTVEDWQTNNEIIIPDTKNINDYKFINVMKVETISVEPVGELSAE